MLRISEIERALENAKRQGNAEAVQKITGILNRVRPKVEARPSREEQKRQYLDSLRDSDFRVGDPSLGANIAGGFVQALLVWERWRLLVPLRFLRKKTN